MSRLSRMLSRSVTAVALATLLFLGGTPQGVAGKPPTGPPPEPTPAGTIYFQVQTSDGAQTWGMDGDGKNKFQALPTGVFGNPSSLLYGAGGRRWWLVTMADGRVYDRVIHPDGITTTYNSPHRELYAVSVNEDFSLESQPVCDSYGKFRFPPSHDGSFNGTRPDYGFLQQWSTEGIDLFVYGAANDISNVFVVEEDGSTTLDLTRPGYNPGAWCRVDVPNDVMAGTGIVTVGQAVEAGVVLGPEALTVLPGNWNGGNIVNTHFSPDGQSILREVMVDHPELGGWVRELHLRDAATGVTLWNAVYDTWQGSQWSPLGGTIAFSEGSDGIWLMAADRSGFTAPVKIHAAPKKPFSRATDPRWSPNAGHLAYFEYAGSKPATLHIYRMKSDGSGVVNLTSDLNSGTNKWPYRWVSDETAPAPLP